MINQQNNQVHNKAELHKIVECIASGSDLNELNTTWYMKHVNLVNELYRSKLFLKIEIPKLFEVDIKYLEKMQRTIEHSTLCYSAVDSMDIKH